MRRLALPFILIGALLCACSDTGTNAGAPPVVGNTAPDFTQNDTSGAPVSLASYRGKVIMIDFWASWCGPCVAALPNVKGLWQKYRNQDFVLISVSLDYNMESWKRFIRDNHLDWIHVSDGRYWNNAVAVQYDVNAIPAVFLIDRKGKIRLIRNFVDGAFESEIQAALAE